MIHSNQLTINEGAITIGYRLIACKMDSKWALGLSGGVDIKLFIIKFDADHCGLVYRKY